MINEKEIIKMKKFKVLVEETHARMIEVKAVDENQALDIVKQMYKNCEIVLDYEDFVNVEIKNEEKYNKKNKIHISKLTSSAYALNLTFFLICV